MSTFLWLHVKKAGGQSMRQALESVYVETDRLNPKPFIAVPKDQWNDTLNNYRMPLGEYDYKRLLFAKKFLYTNDEFSKLFKFVVVRNPYDRAVSSWLYCTRKHPLWKILNIFHPKLAFQNFLENLPMIWRETNKKHFGAHTRHWATHTSPVFSDITDESGNLLVDFIGKLETINSDFDYICDKIGMEKREFPSVNVNSRRNKNSYRKYYNDKSKILVENYYGKDISLFQYEF